MTGQHGSSAKPYLTVLATLYPRQPCPTQLSTTAHQQAPGKAIRAQAEPSHRSPSSIPAVPLRHMQPPRPTGRSLTPSAFVCNYCGGADFRSFLADSHLCVRIRSRTHPSLSSPSASSCERPPRRLRGSGLPGCESACIQWVADSAGLEAAVRVTRADDRRAPSVAPRRAENECRLCGRRGNLPPAPRPACAQPPHPP